MTYSKRARDQVAALAPMRIPQITQHQQRITLASSQMELLGKSIQTSRKALYLDPQHQILLRPQVGRREGLHLDP